jgi:hypothetical protein
LKVLKKYHFIYGGFFGRIYRKDTYGTDPVKLIPLKCGDFVMASPNTGPSAGTKLTTPSGTPASLMIS